MGDRLAEVSEWVHRDVDRGVIEVVYSSTATIQEILFWLYNQGRPAA